MTHFTWPIWLHFALPQVSFWDASQILWMQNCGVNLLVLSPPRGGASNTQMKCFPVTLILCQQLYPKWLQRFQMNLQPASTPNWLREIRQFEILLLPYLRHIGQANLFKRLQRVHFWQPYCALLGGDPNAQEPSQHFSFAVTGHWGLLQRWFVSQISE